MARLINKRLYLAMLLMAYAAMAAGKPDTQYPDFLLNRAAFSDKLTQQTVTQSFQDSSGTLWFVTQEGVNRYTGHELQNYRYIATERTSIPANIVSQVTEDKTGTIWLSTIGGGLTRYNSRSNDFTSISSDPNNRNTPYSNDIKTIFADSNGILWLGYANGFSSFDPASEQFHHFVSGTSDVPATGIISSFTETTDGAIWAATQTSGLIKIDPATGSVETYTHNHKKPNSIVEGQLFEVLADRYGYIWAVSEQNGVSRFNPESKVALNFTHSESTQSLSSNMARDVFEDSNGSIWIATAEGINLYQDNTQSFVRYSTHNTQMPVDNVISIYQTREGMYWVGTSTGLVSGSISQFKRFDPMHGNLSGESVNAFAKTADGSLWVGTDDGLNRMRPESANFEWINESSEPQISSAIVMSLYAEGDFLWIGTFDSGLNKLNVLTNEVVVYRHSSLDQNSIAANGVTSIKRLSSGELLIGTYGGGLSMLNSGDTEFSNFRTRVSDPTTISNDRVLALYEDSFGFVWIGTERGLNRFDPATGTFHRYFADTGSKLGLASNRIWSLYEDASRNLWLGTSGGGLNLWRSENRYALTPKFSHFSENISLPSANIYGIKQDSAGWIWLSHNQGLTRFDPVSLESHQYGVQDGLQAHEFNLGASFKSEDGSLYFGGIAGFNEIDPNVIRLERAPPKVSISQIKVMNERRDFGVSYQSLDLIELSYQDRMLAIEFFAADFSNPDLVNYAYQLEGINPDWVVSPDSRIASFTTLPPGKYTLNLAASSPDGTWNWDGLSLPIIVSPPPWRSPAAYILYLFLAATLIVYYFHRQRRRAAHAREIQRELELRVTERTQDLVAARKEAEQATKAKSDFLATMSHEIRTPMHGIIGMTELLLHTNLSMQQKQFAKAAHKSGESLLGLINEILDFSKVEASKVELEYVEFEIIDLIEDICYLQGEPAARKGLCLNHICSVSAPDKVVGDPTKLRQVIMNLVSNAIKFTHDGNINLKLEAAELEDQENKTTLKIRVEDDGIGMDQDTLARVFEPFTQADTSTTRQYGGTGLGLSISRHYIDLMGGEISVESKVGKGTQVTISLNLQVGTASPNRLPQLDGTTCTVVSENDSTFEMIDSILGRAGISTRRLEPSEAIKGAAEHCDIVLVDYQDKSISNQIISGLGNIDAKVRILMTPLSEKTPIGPFDQWAAITKPIMSGQIFDLVSLGLDNIGAEDRLVIGKTEDRLAGRRLLVAEDVETNQKIILEMLQLLGAQVDIASNGAEAVSKFSANNYSLVFMDCQMPVMDGYAATQEIRKLEASNNSNIVPIIALTAGSDDKDRERCEKAGMNGYVTKPFTLTEISKVAVSHLNGMQQPSLEWAVYPEKEMTNNFEQVPDILNRAALKSIKDVESQTGKELVPALFDGYQSQMAEKLLELKQNVEKNDSTSTYRTAHAIKSMSANMGAERVRIISGEIETSGRKSQIFDCGKALIELDKAYIEFVQEFKKSVITR